MDLTTLGFLAVLALADSTSFGTLLIPIWLLLAAGRPQPGRMLVYLGTVAGFYLVVGLLLSAGAALFLDDLQAWTGTDAGGVVLVLVGAGLIVLSFVLDRRRKAAEREGGGRLLRWRERAMGAESSTGPLMALALAAAGVEVASMLPYLVAVGVMADAGLPPAAHLGLLAAYCLVMILPALLLLTLRLVAHRLVQPLLARINAWLTRSAGDWMPWIVGILGFLVLREGLASLDDAIAWLEVG